MGKQACSSSWNFSFNIDCLNENCGKALKIVQRREEKRRNKNSVLQVKNFSTGDWHLFFRMEWDTHVVSWSYCVQCVFFNALYTFQYWITVSLNWWQKILEEPWDAVLVNIWIPAVNYNDYDYRLPLGFFKTPRTPSLTL